MLSKYLRQERLYKTRKNEAGEEIPPCKKAMVARIKDRITVAAPTSPLVVFRDNHGYLYEFFLNTARSRTMVKDKSLDMVGVFHNEMHEAIIHAQLTA